MGEDGMTQGHAYLRTHTLSAEHLLLDLAEAAVELHGIEAGDEDRHGVTLIKQGGLSVVMTHLAPAATLTEHAARGAATVQVLEGRVRVALDDEEFEAREGYLVAFDSGVRHSVTAIDDSTLLLTLGGG
ncbi:MAG: cupin domain-containing protein [Dehalococcoidia bacterium]|nr:cupin domain-containing protein [Dehalococcoidia bacterium]